MSFSVTPHRRGLERFLAILTAFAVVMSLMVILAPAALAHHPEIDAYQTCIGIHPYIHFDAVSWRTDGSSGSGHPDIRIEIRVNGSGPWTEVASGAFNAANGFRFSGDIDAEPYWGESIEVAARANGPWDNGVAGGQRERVAPFFVDKECETTTTTEATTTTTTEATTTTTTTPTSTTEATTTTTTPTTSTTTVRDEVEGIVITTSSTTSSTVGDTVLSTEVLPFTGLDTGALALLAASTVALGLVLIMGSRREET